MNSPLPKPTPPTNTDDKQQTVVFDQKVPLQQKAATPGAPASQSPTPAPTMPSPTPPKPAVAPSAGNQTEPKDIPTTPPPSTLKPTLPPTSLSALSSMSSNKIPDGKSAPVVQPATPMPQKTVLGQPIPQAIRGEATPVGMGKSAPGMTPPRGITPAGIAATGAAATTTTTTQTAIKQESPSIGGSKNAPAGNAPKFAETKSPIMRFLPFIAGGIILLVVIVFALSRFLGGSSTSVSDNQGTTPTAPTTGGSQRTEVPAQRVTLEYWGLWEPTEVMEQVITSFESENPGIEVNYVKQSPIDYRERLQTAIQSGSGPDLFRFHASWGQMLKTQLDPIPASVATAAEFRENYYPIVTEQLVNAGQYVGLPLMYDGLVLYYNEDILATAGETPPKTWPELRRVAKKITVLSANKIQRGGLAIGNATNVEHFSDILATLILQNDGNLSEADSVETRDALLFYTNFQLEDKVWDETLPSSTVAFARGDVAMMFAPSWRAHEIKALNPNLKFATAPMPQLSDDTKIAWASYWAEGISSASKKKTDAAKFLAYINRTDVLKKFFSDASKVRAFGEIYPKVDMAEELSEDKIIGPILEDAPIAKSGYLNSFTHDNGINDQMITYYKAAIDALLKSGDIEEIQETLSAGVAQVLKQYSVSTK